MATLQEIKARASILSDKIETGSITPEEVGGLIADLASYAQGMERDGAVLGIRRVYPSLEALQKDFAPKDNEGKPLKRGNLVAIYHEATAQTDPNSGLVYVWLSTGWAPVARIGTALRHENTAIEERLTTIEGTIKDVLKVKDGELERAISEAIRSSKEATDALGDRVRALEMSTATADAVAVEARAREDADTEISTRIDEEKQARLNKDNELSGAIGALADEARLRDEQIAKLERSGGGGGGLYNVTTKHPLSSGYYTLEMAVQAVAGDDSVKGDKRGMLITFEVRAGKWVTYRYTGDTTSEQFASAPMWVEEVDLKEVHVDGALQPIVDGVLHITTKGLDIATTVDESDRPVASHAVRTELDKLQELRLDADTESTDEGTQVTLSREGREVAKFVVAGGGGSQGTSTRAVVIAQLDTTRIPVGGSPTLTYGYTHYSDGSQDGLPANIKITIKRGSQVVAELEAGQLASGDTRTLPLGQYVRTASSYSISVVATYLEDGANKTRTALAHLSVVDLSISLYNKQEVQTYLSAGGYKDGDTANIIIQVKGGARELSLYIDGDDTPHETKVLTGSGGRQTFVLPLRTLSPGAHSLQVVARLDNVKSNSIYLDIFKAGVSRAFIGLLFSRPDGHIISSGQTPEMIGKQYASLSWEYIAIGTQGGVADLRLHTPSGIKAFASPRGYQVATERLMSRGTLDYRYELEGMSAPLRMQVSATDIEGLGIKDGASLELLAQGRSNAESNPAEWRSGKFQTLFEGVDWRSSGWTGDALRLINGAKARIGYAPYATDAKTTGQTIILELKTTNVRHIGEAVVSCYDKEGHASGAFGGFIISPYDVRMPFGGSVDYLSETGMTVTRDLGINMRYASGVYYHLAIVVHPESDHKHVRLYINGVLSKADTYVDTIFAQRTPQGILLDSTSADLEVRHVRVYPTSLSDDEVFQNYVTDRPAIDEMEVLLDRNDILDPQTGDVSWDKLIAKGLGVLNISMDGGLEKLWGKSTDTKTRYPVKELIFRSPLGRKHDLRVVDCTLRRQGTSTSTYPFKGLRAEIERLKTTKVFRNVGVDGNDVWELISDRRYTMREGGKSMGIINIKTYYADSSMQNDMGGAHLWNKLCREIPELTTPGMIEDPQARASNDGIPCSLFTSDTPEGAKRFCGTAWFNNDKSKSGYIYGQTKGDGTHIALEGINNTNSVALYTFEGDVATQLARPDNNGFDASFEFLYPEKDYLWSTAPENIKQSVVRLMQFIKDCTPSGVDPSRMKTSEVKTAFKNDKFRREVGEYLSVASFCAWYVWTDYFMAVDQRAKNTFLRTWDGLIWWMTYYDGDNQFGKTNEAMLALLYNLSRDTWDPQRGKYAFEGHNSMLWCLILANLEDELKNIAVKMRGIMTDAVVRQYLNSPLRDYPEVLHNKSNINKYIKPTYIDYNGGGTMNYIFACDGTMQAVKEGIIQRRFSLLDAYYNPDDAVRKDNIPCYIGKGATPTIIRVTAGDEYFFGWGTQNGVLRQYQQVEAGASFELSFSTAITINDPVRIAGASRIQRIDLATTARYVQGAMNLNSCRMLEDFVGAIAEGHGSQWFPLLGAISGLKRVDLTGQTAVSGTESAQSLTFDVSSHTGLQELKLRGTAVRAIRIADGAPITTLELPATLDKLRLRALPNLTMSGLVVASWEAITSLELAGCPHLDWRQLLERCTRLERLRIEGVRFEDDGTLLQRLSSIKGIDASGGGVDSCELVGVVQLTKYIDEATMRQWRAHYPSLEIRQPEYTVVEFDERASDPANMSNLDNNTGYKFGNKYVPSAHIKAILDARMGVVGKQGVKGKMSIYPLHNWDFTKFADSAILSQATSVATDGTDGDFFIYEPEYWYKGVNDYKANKNIACFAYGRKPSNPDPALIKVVKYTEIDVVQRDKSVVLGGQNFSASLRDDALYNTYRVDVSGYKRVRTQVSAGSAGECVLFLREDNSVISPYSISGGTHDFVNGMYVIHDIPEGCRYVAFCVEKLAEPVAPFVVLSNSSKLEDFEPEWVHHKAVLVGMFKGQIDGGKFCSHLKGGDNYPTTGLSLEALRNLANSSSLKVATYEVMQCIFHLSLFKYGTRNYHASYANSPSGNYNTRIINGRLLATGMGDIERSSDGSRIGYYLYRDGDVVSFIPSSGIGDANYPASKIMGYEQLSVGHPIFLDDAKYLGLSLKPVNGNAYSAPISRIGNRTLTTTSNNGYYAKAIVFGKYIDLIGLNHSLSNTATETTHWSSFGPQDVQGYNYNTERGFVLGISSGHNVKFGFFASIVSFGLEYMTARPMFDGEIERVLSLDEYKRIENKA